MKRQTPGECGSTCDGAAGGPEKTPDSLDQYLEAERLSDRLGRIRHKILVMSGKGEKTKAEGDSAEQLIRKALQSALRQ